MPGRAFEDILDGYFPLGESVRQMMARNRFTSIWINLLHAPVMDLPGLPPTAPVPLHLPRAYSGMIDAMTLTAVLYDGGARMAGVGNWFWIDGREETGTFPALTRLGEPAFIRGIGLGGNIEAGAFPPTVAVARPGARVPVEAALEQATARLGWRASRAWGLGQPVAGIGHAALLDLPRALQGRRFDVPHRTTGGLPLGGPRFPADGDYLLLDLSADQQDAEALELALRL